MTLLYRIPGTLHCGEHYLDTTVSHSTSSCLANYGQRYATQGKHPIVLPLASLGAAALCGNDLLKTSTGMLGCAASLPLLVMGMAAVTRSSTCLTAVLGFGTSAVPTHQHVHRRYFQMRLSLMVVTGDDKGTTSGIGPD